MSGPDLGAGGPPARAPRRVTGALCHRLRPQVATIGLDNGAPDNRAARRVHQRLGFVEVVAFEEAALARRDQPPLVGAAAGD